MRNLLKLFPWLYGFLMLCNAYTMWTVFAEGAPVILVALPAVMFVFCGALFSKSINDLNELKEEE